MQTKSPDERPLWLFLSEPGLSNLLARELKHRDIIRQKARPERLLLRSCDVLALPSSQVIATKPRSRLALEILVCPVFGRHRIGDGQLDRLAKHWKKEKPSELTSTVAGSVFRREDVMRLVQRGLRERGAEPAGTNAAAARLLIVDERFYFGFSRFNYHQEQGRERDEDRRGSLPPTIAAAMCFAAKPGASEVIWDPVAGSGTLLVEARAFVADAVLIGSDIDGDAIKLAKKNLRGVANVSLVQADSRELLLDRNDVTLTLGNLPFGKQFKSDDAKALYAGLLAQSLAHAAPNWRCVLLTSDDTALRAAVSSLPGLKLEQIAKPRVRGHEAMMWLITRAD